MRTFLYTIFGLLLAGIFLPASASAEKKFKILTIQHQSFSPYTLSLKGFENGIKHSDIADSISIENYNAQSNLTDLEQFIQKVKQRMDIDLIFTIGTRGTQQVIKEIKKIPVVFTDLGAPESSGIINDWKGSHANYTGVETRNYVAISINLLYELIHFKSIGMIYSKGSPSHEGAVKAVDELSREEGFEFHSAGFKLRDEQGNLYPEDHVRDQMKACLEKIAPKVDVFYVQISNTFEKNFDLFYDCFKKHSLPSAGEPIYIQKGLVIGIGRHKEKFGAQCAEYAVKILKGEDPGSMPMDTGKEFSFSLNIEAATHVGYNPSIDILGAADIIYKKKESTDE